MEKMKSEQIDKYIPEIISSGTDTYGLMIVELHKCGICKKNMLYGTSSSMMRPGPFPSWSGNGMDAQIKRAGWVKASSTKVDDEYVCCDCVEAGKADFLCAQCNKRKTINKIQESFGDPQEFLCTDCYESTPAKAWDEKVDKIRETHRYDFE